MVSLLHSLSTIGLVEFHAMRHCVRCINQIFVIGGPNAVVRMLTYFHPFHPSHVIGSQHTIDVQTVAVSLQTVCI